MKTKSNHNLFYIALCLLLLLSCSSNVGTRTGNPTTPSIKVSNLSPDFDEYLLRATLGVSEDSSSSLSTNSPVAALAYTVTGPAGKWDKIRDMAKAQIDTNFMNDFLTEIMDKLTENNISYITETEQTITTDSMELYGTTAAFEVTIKLDETDTDYIRINYKNTTANYYQGTYFFKQDNDGNPVKGMFVYVDPTLFNTTTTGTREFVNVSFDFSDSTKLLFLLRTVAYSRETSEDKLIHVHYECDLTNSQCTSDYISVSGDDTPSFDDNGARYTWNDSTNDVCIETMTYSNDLDAETGDETQSFTGPEQPTEDSEVTTDDCTISESCNWCSHDYALSDLPQNYQSTTATGRAKELFGDNGSTTDGFDTLTPSMIDSYLDASGF